MKDSDSHMTQVISRSKANARAIRDGQHRITVSLESRSYEIVIAPQSLLQTIGEHSRDLGLPGRCLVVTSPLIRKLHGEALQRQLLSSSLELEFHEIPDGEQYKTFEQFQILLGAMARFDQDRRFFVLCFGGGVVGDVAGFAAATYKRGTPYVYVPTTLLADVDCSVGGKLGVDLPEGKNLIGCFYQPRLVLIDLSLLSTLPDRELRSGMGEIIKYGIIRDPMLFGYLEDNVNRVFARDTMVLSHLVETACRHKASIVQDDERDTGVRRTLNCGHTFGHALEAATGYTEFAHGEAVAIGLACACDLGVALQKLGSSDAARIKRILKKYGLPTTFQRASIDNILEAMKRDKKFINDKNRFVVPTGIGSVEIIENIPWDLIRGVVNQHREG